MALPLRTSLLALLLAGSLVPLAGMGWLEYQDLKVTEVARERADFHAAGLAAALRADDAAMRGGDALVAASDSAPSSELLLLSKDGSYRSASGGGVWPELASRIGDRVSGVERIADPAGRDVEVAWGRAPLAGADVVLVRDPIRPTALAHIPFLLLGAFLALGVAVVLGYVTTRVVAPVGRLEGASRRLARGEWHERVVPEGPKEVRALASAFNAMAEELERKRLELHRLLEDRTRTLIDREGDLDALRFTLAHEFREPLRSLRWMADDLLDGPLDRDAREATLVLRRRIDDVDAVFRDLLRYEDVSRRAAPIDAVPLGDVLRVAIRDAEAAGPLRVEAEPLPVVQGNRDLLALAFVEILRNAAQHAHVRGAPRVRVSAEIEGDDAILRFDDDGPGIPTARRNDALHLFQRLRRDVPGTGAGLAIARRAVERHDGALVLGASPMGGARVEVRIPIVGPAPRADVVAEKGARRF